MKRSVLYFIFIIAAGLSAMVWRTDDFESGNLGDIINYDLDSDGSLWEVVPSAKKAGSYMVRSESAGRTPDNMLCYPSVYVERNSYLSFWIGAEDSINYTENYQIYLDFTAPCQTEFSQIIWEETLTSSEWKKVEIDLKPIIQAYDSIATEANIYIGIRHFGSSNQSALLLDDVKLWSPLRYIEDGFMNLTPEGVFEPFTDIYNRWFPYDRSGWDADWNFIGYPDVSLHYIITDKDGVQAEQTIVLIPETDPESDYYSSYSCTIEGKTMGSFIEYWAVTTDSYGTETRSASFFLEWGEINYSEGFEYSGTEASPPVGWLPDGWISFQTGNPLNGWDRPWEVNVPSQNVHTGDYSATSASQNNFGVFTTENYLVSPIKRINGEPTLKYFVNAQVVSGYNYRERWSVLVSTAEGDLSDILDTFVEVQKDSIIPTSSNLDTWYEKSVFLGAYKDQNVRIMWKHNYTSTTAKLDRFLNIDDVRIEEKPQISFEGTGNAAVPNEDYIIDAVSTDYSGIKSFVVYYTLQGQPEASVSMTDIGNHSFTGAIPAQPENTRGTWYAVVTDNSIYENTTVSDTYEMIWFGSGALEWGSDYSDYPDPVNIGNKLGTDWNFGLKANLYLNKIEVGFAFDAPDLEWKLVEFDSIPTKRVIGDLSGIYSFKAGGDELLLGGKTATLGGHIALVFDSLKTYNEIMLDESGNKTHSWQWDQSNGWTTNLWGAFYIKMYVSQTPNGIEDEFVSSTTELCQNYPNPFNPETSISFYNRIAGDVSLTVYNTKGEKVAVLLNEHTGEGFRKINFNSSGINSGVYYYTLRTPEKTLTKKMVLIK